MTNPIFWLGLSTFLVAVSLLAMLIAALPALQELARAAHSAEKLFDTLRRDFPPTLEAIRLTGLEISELTDEINQGVKSASDLVKQVDRSFSSATKQANKVQLGSGRIVAGVKAAFETWNRYPLERTSSLERLNPFRAKTIEFREQAPTRKLSMPLRKPQTGTELEG